MTTHSAGADRQHQHMREQLPWYVNQTLSTAERLDVERHLTSCPDCQAELLAWRQLAGAVQEVEASIPTLRPEQFAALMDQIDAAAPAPPIPHHWRRALRERVGAWLPVWGATPTFARWAIAAQAVVIILLGGLLMWRDPTPSASLYQTLSSEAPSKARLGRMQLIFTPGATVRQMQRLLTASQATIVAGPSAMGVYTVEIALPTHAPEALTVALERLRAHPAIELAEPVSGP